MSGLGLEPDAGALRRLGADALERLVGFHDDVGDRPVLPSPWAGTPTPSPVAEDGDDPDALLSEVFDCARHAVETAGPRHFGYVPAGGLFSSAVGELLARGLNRYAAVPRMAPALAATEDRVLDWLIATTGLPRSTAGGLLTTGGSLATLSALVAARHHGLGPDPAGGTVYVAEHTHHCVHKAALIAGLPASAVRTVPSPDGRHADPDALRAAIRADRAAGRRPFLLVGTAGTTSAGSVDDLDALADVARDEDVWFHVDAAYGGFFALTDRGARLLRGLGRADSIVLDPHKSMFLPYGSGVLLVRDAETLRRAHDPDDDPVYLRDLAGNGPPDPADLGPERTRELRGLRMWLPLRLHGARAFREALDEKLDLARAAYRELAAEPGLVCPWEPELSTVVFRARDGDARTHAVRDRVLASGAAFCSGTEIDGRYHLRLCILSFRTHAEHVRDAVVAVRAAVRATGAEPA